MRNVRKLTALALATVGVLAFTSAPALAAEHWGALGSFGLAPADPAPLSNPAGLAVNQSTGDVYVVDKGNSRVEWFDSAGKYEGQFNGGATPAKAFSEPEGIAVDNDPGSHSFGDVYVIDEGHSVIDKFSSTGAYIGQIAGTCENAGEIPSSSCKAFAAFVTLDGVAVDSHGTLWVENSDEGYSHPAIDSFSDEQPTTFLASSVSQVENASEQGLAVDTEDNLYVVHSGELKVAKANSAGEVVAGASSEQLGGVEGATGVAVDSDGNDVYIDAGTSVVVVNPAESLVESFGGGLLSEAGSLAVDPAVGASGYAYVVEPGDNDVLILEHSATSLPAPPAPTTNPATEVTGISVELHGELNPGGVAGGVGYYFSYNAGAGSTCTGSGSVKTLLDNGGGNLTGTSEEKVSATVVLNPHEEYVYCLVAAGYGVTPGNEVSFLTHGERPVVVSEGVSSLSAELAQFTATINPEFEETKYYFEYSTELSGGELKHPKKANSPTEEEGELPPVFKAEPASSEILELYKETDTYYYRVVATNATGERKGPIQEYTKLPVVSDESASELTLTGAMLEAKVNPFWQETKYHFEYAETKAELENHEGIAIEGATGKQQQKKLEELANLEKKLEREEKEEKAGLLPEGTVPPGSLPICPGIVEDGGTGTLPGVVDKASCPVSAEIAGLQPNRTYYYRAVAENATTENANNANAGKPALGAIEQFKTESQPLFVATGGVQNITSTGATFSGSVTPLDQPTTYYFQYISEMAYQTALAKGVADPYEEGETTAPQTLTPNEAPQAIGPIPARSLLPETTYRYRLAAKNEWGVEYGEPNTFTTAAATPPLVSTGGASNVSQNAATLSGTVTTNGLQTNYGFEIGTAPGVYGPATGLGAVGGAATEEVHVTLGELQPGTTYYYRVEATNADGAVQGQPVSFTTPGFPSLISPPASPPLIAYTAPAFPKETANTQSPTIAVLSHKVKGDTATLEVSVPSAGKLVATGKGLSKGSAKATKAGDVTVKVTLTKAEQARLAKHKGRKLSAKINLQFTPTKGSKLATTITVLVG